MDFVILNSDQAIFDPSFSPAVVIPMPGIITGTAMCNSSRLMACVEGDEASVIVPGVVYTSGAFTVPGTGTLTIDTLGADQTARNAKSSDKALILKGTKFIAKFQVMAPAQVPPPTSTPDPVPTYYGKGSFVTTNAVFKAA